MAVTPYHYGVFSTHQYSQWIHNLLSFPTWISWLSSNRHDIISKSAYSQRCWFSFQFPYSYWCFWREVFQRAIPNWRFQGAVGGRNGILALLGGNFGISHIIVVKGVFLEGRNSRSCLDNTKLLEVSFLLSCRRDRDREVRAPKGQILTPSGRNSQAKGLQLHPILESSRPLAWTPTGKLPGFSRG